MYIIYCYLLNSTFFFNDPATTEIYTLSLHDALPIFALDIRDIIVCGHSHCGAMHGLTHLEEISEMPAVTRWLRHAEATRLDRKSTRLNSSHVRISYAVFCLKKKNNIILKRKEINETK